MMNMFIICVEFLCSRGLAVKNTKQLMENSVSRTVKIDKIVYDKSLYLKRITTVQPIKKFSIYGNVVKGLPVITTIGYNYGRPEPAILMILNSEKLKESMTGYKQKYICFHNVDDFNYAIALVKVTAKLTRCHTL